VVIDNEDELYHRVFPYFVKPDASVSSAAFMDRRKKPLNRFSVDLARLTTIQRALSFGPGGQRLIALKAKTPRSLGFAIWHEPEGENDAQCNVEGENTKGNCFELARNSWPVPAVE
jgi:hypothetical protein